MPNMQKGKAQAKGKGKDKKKPQAKGKSKAKSKKNESAEVIVDSDDDKEEEDDEPPQEKFPNLTPAMGKHLSLTPSHSFASPAPTACTHESKSNWISLLRGSTCIILAPHNLR